MGEKKKKKMTWIWIAVGVAIAFWIDGVSTQDCGVGGGSSRIVGGNDAADYAWPWQVQLTKKSPYGDVPYCGASVINDRWILTAAHCFEKTGRRTYGWRAELGVTNKWKTYPTRQLERLSRIEIHPEYKNQNGRSANTDIALVKTVRPLRFSKGIQRVCLPEADDGSDEKMSPCVSTGWGLMKDEEKDKDRAALQQVTLPFIDEATCRAKWNGNKKVNEKTICFGTDTQGTCSGDSGGPITCRGADGKWTQVGLVAWGHRDCRGFPSVYTRVSKYLDWIHETIEK